MLFRRAGGTGCPSAFRCARLGRRSGHIRVRYARHTVPPSYGADARVRDVAFAPLSARGHAFGLPHLLRTADDALDGHYVRLLRRQCGRDVDISRSHHDLLGRHHILPSRSACVGGDMEVYLHLFDRYRNGIPGHIAAVHCRARRLARLFVARRYDLGRQSALPESGVPADRGRLQLQNGDLPALYGRCRRQLRRSGTRLGIHLYGARQCGLRRHNAHISALCTL